MSSPSVTLQTAGGVIGKYTLICELGGRAPTTFAAHTSVLGELVIVEKLARAGLSAKEIDTFARTARRLARTTSPSLPRVREVLVTSQLVAIASDFVEGETLAELSRLELAVRLRILVDLLGGLGAIHEAAELDKTTEPMAIVHGEVTPANVLVGLDGITRIIRPHRVPRRGTVLPEHEKASLGYVAPETLVGDGPDPRADLYAVGVMLWEAISGERLFSQSTPEAALTVQLAGDLPRAKLPDDAAWAEPLVNIAARALQVSPQRRFGTAKDFADAIRRAVEPELAPTLRVAAAVSARAGEKIEARRKRLKPPQSAVTSRGLGGAAPRAGSPPRPGKSSPAASKAKEDKAEEIDWVDVLEAKAPARSMPPPVPSRVPSQAPPPAMISMDTLVPPVSAPPVVEAPTTKAVDAPDTTPDIAASIPPSTTSEDTEPLRLRTPRNPRIAIVAGLVGLCIVILMIAGIRAASGPSKDAESFAKKSDPVMPMVHEPPPPPPVVVPPPPPEPEPVAAIAVPSPPEPVPPPEEPAPPPAPREPAPPHAASPPVAAGKTTARPATPKVPKPRPKSNYEPQGI